MDAPQDPFAGDPEDPARELAALDGDAAAVPLPPHDREDVLSDLEDLEVFDALLSPKHVRGLVVACPDCEVPHFLTWDLLRANLRALLDTGRERRHEPAAAPDPRQYVTWEYARGYADAALDG